MRHVYKKHRWRFWSHITAPLILKRIIWKHVEGHVTQQQNDFKCSSDALIKAFPAAQDRWQIDPLSLYDREHLIDTVNTSILEKTNRVLGKGDDYERINLYLFNIGREIMAPVLHNCIISSFIKDINKELHHPSSRT